MLFQHLVCNNDANLFGKNMSAIKGDRNHTGFVCKHRQNLCVCLCPITRIQKIMVIEDNQ